MRLIKLHIDGFGKLIDFDYEFKEINVIYEKNGYGKSTIANFIFAMLYDMDKIDRVRFNPISGNAYGGTLILDNKGIIYKIVRKFSSSTSSKSSNETYLYKNNILVEIGKNSIGELLFNLSKDSFERLVFIKNNELDLSKDSDIKNNLFGTTGIEERKIDEVIDNIDKKISSLVSTKSTKHISKLVQLKEEIKGKNNSLKNKENISQILPSKYKQLEELNDSVRRLERIKEKKQNIDKLSSFNDEINNRRKIIDDLNSKYNKREITESEFNEISGKYNKWKEFNESKVESLTDDEKSELEKLKKAYKGRNIEKDQEKLAHLHEKLLTKQALITESKEILKVNDKSNFKMKASKYSNIKIYILILFVFVLILALGISIGFLINWIIGGVLVTFGIVPVLCLLLFKSFSKESDNDGILPDVSKESNGINNVNLAKNKDNNSKEVVELENEIKEIFDSYLIAYGPDKDFYKCKEEILGNQRKLSYLLDKVDKNETSFQNLKNASEELAKKLMIFGLTLEEFDFLSFKDDYEKKKKTINELKSLVEMKEKFKVEEVDDSEEYFNGEKDVDYDLDEKTKELNNLEREIENEENEISDLNELKSEIERLNYEKENVEKEADILKKTKKYLLKAHDLILRRYLDPLKRNFKSLSDIFSEKIAEKLILDENFNIHFENKSGKNLEENQLSSGEKLICTFCLRVALINQIFENTNLPFLLLDDPFYSLDEINLERLKLAINKLSKTNQLVYFTCHSSRNLDSF